MALEAQVAPAIRSLSALLAQDAAQPVSPALAPLIEAVQPRFAGSIQAILFYGSCMRAQDCTDGIADIYVLVDDYRHCYRHRPIAWANAVLPPNVFLLNARAAAVTDSDADGNHSALLGKCAVLSLRDFENGLTRWFHSYLWGRFAQPCRLVYCRDEAVAFRIHQARAQAVLRLLAATLPLMPARFDAATLWQRALACCYATELRPERGARAAALAAHDAALYQRLTEAALGMLATLTIDDDGLRHVPLAAAAIRARCLWWWRRRVGRSLNLLRLIKASFTFSGGVDYLLWKLERHTGSPIVASERLRRHPLIFGWPLLWRLWRSGRLG